MYQKVDLNAFSGEYALAQQRPPKWPRIWASSIPQDAFDTTIDIKSFSTIMTSYIRMLWLHVGIVGTTQCGQVGLSKTVTQTEAPTAQQGHATASSSIVDHVLFFSFLFFISIEASRHNPVRTVWLSKTEAHTEAPITQLGRATASSSIVNHVWFISLSFFYFNWFE